MTPFCPRCRAEYREGFRVCYDCQAELVDSLPPEPVRPEEAAAEMVPVFDAPDQMSAMALGSFLNQNGIRAVVRSEQIPMYDGVAMMLFPRWGQVLVLEHQYRQAQELTEDFWAGEPLDQEEPPQ